MVGLNLTRQPTFFGCNASDETPLILYLPNSPWSSYSNFSYMQETFTDEQLDVTFDNAFQLATYGNGTIDENWPACLACATIRGSARRVGVTLPDQCTQCLQRHCWNGETSDRGVTDADFDLPLRLDPGVSYETWNETTWLGGPPEIGGHRGSGGSGGGGNDGNENIAASKRLGSSAFAILVATVLAICIL